MPDATDVLRSTPLFAALDADALARLATAATPRRYRRGEFLCQQGDPGDRLFVVVEGLVKVVLGAPSGDQVVLATHGRSETLGELALLDGAPRSASVVAVEPTVVLTLARRTLFDAMTEHPEVLEVMLRSLGGLVRRLTEQTGDFVFLDLGGRVAKALLRLSRAHGSGDDDALLDLHLSQSDLAAMVGGSRPAVNRALQLMASRGWISVDGQVILIRDRRALLHRAGA